MMDDPFNSLEAVKSGGQGRVRKVMEQGVKVEPMGPSEPPPVPPVGDEDPPPPAGWDLSHDQLALDLGAAGLDQDARYVPTWARWLHWTGSHFAHDDKMRTYAVARRYLRSVAHRIEHWAEKEAANLDAKAADKLRAWAKAECRTLRHKQTVAAVIDLARSNDAIAARPEEFDANPWLLATPGGTVDLHTGELREARRADLISKCCAVTPAPGRPEVWLRFLDTTFDANPDVITFIHQALGYSLTGFTREHKLFFCFGSGANGKSTLLNLLAWMMDDYARRAPAETFLAKTGTSHPTDIAGFQGARLIVASELSRGRSWDEEVIKSLTGGDKLSARFMRGDFFDFDPVGKLWIAGNTQPSFKGVDEAIRRRLVLIPFTVTIPAAERDPELLDKLKAEAPQILSWMIEGARRWAHSGLKVPAELIAASGDYLDNEDTLGQFLEDETIRDPAAFVTASDLHQRFGQWAAAQGLGSWTRRTLSKELVTRGFAEARRNFGRGFLGVRLK